MYKTIPMKQKNPQVVKFREKLRLLKNRTPHLPLGHFKLMFFFPKSVLLSYIDEHLIFSDHT